MVCAKLWFRQDSGCRPSALVTGRTGNTKVLVVWAWMLWLSDARGTRTFLWFGHGCSGYRMLREHERYYGLGMGALVTGCIRNTNVFITLPPLPPPTQSSKTSQNSVRKSPRLHMLAQNLYYVYINCYCPKPRYLVIGYMDPLGTLNPSPLHVLLSKMPWP